MSRQSEAWNRELVGRPEGRWLIDTPALVLDLDLFERNLEVMHGLARERGIALRPHAKTHKSAEIGRRQMAAGAIGLCCAKLGEAEALADEGLEKLHLTSPVTGRGKVDRLLALNARSDGLMAVVDDLANVEELAAATEAHGARLRLLIDVDVGTHRFGVTSLEEARALAERIARSPGLELWGVQGYAGHIQSIRSYAERRAASHEAVAILGRIRDGLEAAGHPCPIVTGSGTGTHDFDHEPGIFTDLQVGSYIFSDVVYDGVEMTPDGGRRFQPSLFVYSRVVSRRHAAFATIDAGFKSFSMDGPMPRLKDGPTPGSSYGRFGDEFGRLDLEAATRPVEIGELTVWIVPHCDPTLNNFDHYHCVRGDELVDIWPIEARGCAG